MPLMSSALWLKMMQSLHVVDEHLLALKVTNTAVPFRKEHFREGYVTISDFRVERVHFRIEYRMPPMSNVLWLKMMQSLHIVFKGLLAL